MELLGPMRAIANPVVARERSEDLKLVDTVVQILETLKRYGTGVQLVTQSTSAIRTLQAVVCNEGRSSGDLRVEIPHFGAVRIARSGAV